MTQEIDITLEFTPNPKTLKYTVNRRWLLVGSEYFVSAEEAAGHSPLAVTLFGLGDISAVMFGPDFVTVTLEEPSRLRELNRQIIDTIRAQIESGVAAVTPRDEEERFQNLDAASQMIRQILEDEVRPAVAQDGGDIVFERFQDGKVFVHMKGSCAGCPSSQATLKEGIETRLKMLVPEVREVVPLV
jgi:Fe-S cluster biogenesis protein NfuA